MSTGNARLILVLNGLGGIALAFGQPRDWLWLMCGIIMPGVSFALAAGFPYFSKRAARLRRLIKRNAPIGR
jgi:hypothetical protein